ncbi:hypothetical protein Y032_0326g2582 [Ancylostoma ceylanicum]|uniref:Uncharacterized protein n=1 Tax=Ancylostoma ceylanicum TaxID=53326 RepID=A0A016S0W3_9BILA|nr:hypothetical protein Y032_0326g2582 [Ancylostoma ceylanicum]
MCSGPCRVCCQPRCPIHSTYVEPLSAIAPKPTHQCRAAELSPSSSRCTATPSHQRHAVASQRLRSCHASSTSLDQPHSIANQASHTSSVPTSAYHRSSTVHFL